MNILDKLKSIFKSNDDSVKQPIRGQQTLVPHDNISSTIIYIDESIIKQNRDSACIIWYAQWSVGNVESSKAAFAFLDTIRSIPGVQWMIHGGVGIYSLIVNFTLDTIQEACIKIQSGWHSGYDQFRESLIEDLTANIPQSYITNEYLNKNFKYTRTTFDGALDEDFNELPKVDSVYPIKRQTFTVQSADNLEEIYDKLVYINPSFMSYGKLLGILRIKLTVHLINKDYEIFTTLNKLPEELNKAFSLSYNIDESEAASYVRDIIGECIKCKVLPEDYSTTDIRDGFDTIDHWLAVHEQLDKLQESNEEVITDEIITDDNERNDNNARKN